MTIVLSVPTNGAVQAPGAALPAGAPGPSAYALAVAAGFVGTEEQWRASLQGQPGEPGRPGNPGADGLVRSVNGKSAADITLTEDDIGVASVADAVAGQATTGIMTPDLVRRREAASLTSVEPTSIGGSIAAAVLPLAPKQAPTLTTATLAGLTTHGDKVTAPASSMALSLASQPTPNYGSDLMQGGSKRAGAMEFFRATDITVTHGASDRTADANAYKAAKVGDYVALTATPTAGDCYAFNGLVNCQAGHPGAAIAFEANVNDANVPGTARRGTAPSTTRAR